MEKEFVVDPMLDNYRFLARYNTWFNARLFDACERLDDAARKLPRGAFFGSIHATLNHLLWGDTMWLGRFAAQGEASDALPTDLLALPAGARHETELHADWARCAPTARGWTPQSKPGWPRCRRTSRSARCATATQRVCSANTRCGRP
jgi:hypothetical protein